MANSACGDGNPRVRRWAFPRAAFFDLEIRGFQASREGSNLQSQPSVTQSRAFQAPIAALGSRRGGIKLLPLFCVIFICDSFIVKPMKFVRIPALLALLMLAVQSFAQPSAAEVVLQLHIRR